MLIDVTLADDQPTTGDVRLQFAVRDTGIGISPEAQAGIFDAFNQADTSVTRRYGGTGLGLTISAQLVAMMGGEIWVESREGEGSTFFFTGEFPLSEAEPKVPAMAEELAGLRVLVVDDNATNRFIFEETLRGWQMAPQVADGAAAALAALREAEAENRPFKLALVDVMMPDEDGFTLIEKINADPELTSPIIIIASSGVELGERKRAAHLGVAQFLIKPVIQSELFDAVLGALGRVGPSEVESSAPEVASPESLNILLAEDSVINSTLR